MDGALLWCGMHFSNVVASSNHKERGE